MKWLKTLSSWFKIFRRKKEQQVRSGQERPLSKEEILAAMEKLKPEFDLRDPYWKEHPEEFWERFKGKTTDSIRVPENFRDWIIGQDEAVKKVDLILLRWLKLVKDLQRMRKERKTSEISRILKERPTVNILLLGEPGTGKCYARGTKILMYDGSIKNVEEIKEGDLLMGPDSRPRRVLSTTRGTDMMYKIIPIKGEPFVVNGSHILVLIDDRRDDEQIKEVTVEEWLRWPKTWKRRFKLFRINPYEKAKDVVRTGFSIEKVGIGDYYGFMLDGDGRHLLGDFTVSHNSLLIKVAAERLKELYEKEGIQLKDAVLIENKANKYMPFLRYVPAGMGRRLVEVAYQREVRKNRLKSTLVYGALGVLISLGALLIALGLRAVVLAMMAGYDFTTALLSSASVYFFFGVTMIGLPAFILVLLFFMRGFGLTIAKENLKIPNLLVDNSPEVNKYYEEATVTRNSLLFGDIEWDPFQTSALSTPPYMRVKAGLVHKADMKILYIDEIKNLSEQSAIELLTLMENGEAPIRAHEAWGAGTATLNVETPPVRCTFLLMCAGNLDVLYDKYSILNRISALRDRFENYGDIILLKDEVPATPYTSLQIVQVIRDELMRFGLPPMEAEAVYPILDFMKRRASSKTRYKMMFRAVIKVLNTAAQLCWAENGTIILKKHVEEALEKYMKTIERQQLEHELGKKKPYSIVEVTGRKVGVVNGLGVVLLGGSEGSGQVIPVEVWVKKVESGKGEIVVSGIVSKGEDVKDSIKDLRTVIYRLYGVDLAKDYYVHIKFAQTRIDGPSAGVTMSLAVMSYFGDYKEFRKTGEMKPIPLRQDIAVTGALDIQENNDAEIHISAIGGVDEKIRAAEAYGLKKVILPKRNYDLSFSGKYGIEVEGCETLLEYFQRLTE